MLEPDRTLSSTWLRPRFTDVTLPWTAEESHPPFADFSGRERKADRRQPEWIRKKYFGE